jgi:hypothetical protein
MIDNKDWKFVLFLAMNKVNDCNESPGAWELFDT